MKERRHSLQNYLEGTNMKFLDQLWDSVKDVKELAKSADAAHDVNELVKAKSADVAKDLEATLKVKAEELKQKAREVKDITADAAKDITETVKEKSAGAAKDIRAKVAEKTESKENAEVPSEAVATEGGEKTK